MKEYENDDQVKVYQGLQRIFRSDFQRTRNPSFPRASLTTAASHGDECIFEQEQEYIMVDGSTFD